RNSTLSLHDALPISYRAVEQYVQKPIDWVQIHKLPDHAYFNHAQHFEVAGIACQTCHGAVEEMEVVKQFSPLTMGWCIDCHRTTDRKSTRLNSSHVK